MKQEDALSSVSSVSWCLRTGCWGRYLDLCGRKYMFCSHSL